MTLLCHSCGASLPDGARFCSTCGSPLAKPCASCGAEVPSDAKFCLNCGAPQVADAASAQDPPVQVREERKVISVLFADLVGFTSASEQADPEDVRARLSVYHRHIREDVERHGGKVEKLMGDGVFAVFGAPTAHEDDPERAVRAALRIQESVDRLNEEYPALGLSVRIAVTTGEAIVQLDRSDQDREGIIGDVVNTASRLEGVAEPGTVVVDERTSAGARATIEFAALEPVALKGKAEPVPIWRALRARSRLGGYIEEEMATPFVGRQSELDLLVTRFERAQRENAVELVTVVGEPGVGKTRLINEFRQVVDDLPDIVWWRQGRCLPYGEGITFWAIAEVLKAQADILDSDSPAVVDAKLGRAVEALVHDPVKASWVKARLGPLVGGASRDEGATQAELFAALLRFFEAMASSRPLVLVIEDLQWADPALLDFLNHLLEWAVDAPIMLLGTARPELLDVQPDWGAGKRNASTVGLSRLTDEDTSRLIGSLLGRTMIDAGVQKSILERCAGNPLYVTEFVRYATERGILDQLADGLDSPMPDSIQALIAARLDLLATADKAVLQAAAAVGRVFWTDSLAATSATESSTLRDSLRRLAVRELIRPVRQPSLDGQEEWAFSHALINEVAYRQIPKAERRHLHETVARWIRDTAGDRLPEVAELLAHHYEQVVALSADSLNPTLARNAYEAMFASGIRLRDLDARRAELYFDRAAEIAPGPAERAQALTERTLILSGEDDLDTAMEINRQGIEAAREAGDAELEARALAQLANIHWYRGDSPKSRELLQQAHELLEGRPPSQTLARVLTSLIFDHHVNGKPDEALDLLDRSRETIMTHGTTEEQGRIMQIGADIRLQRDDATALEDSRAVVDLFLDRNITARAAASYNNYATMAVFFEDANTVAAVMDEAIAMCLERGYTPHSEFSRMTRFESWFPLGRWDDMLADAEEIAEADAARGGSKVGRWISAWKAAIAYERNDLKRADELYAGQVEAAIAEGDALSTAGTYKGAILIALALGRTEQAIGYARDYAALLDESPEQAWSGVAELAWPLVEADALDLLERMVSKSRGQGAWGAARWDYSNAVIAFARDELDDALRLVDSAMSHVAPLQHVHDPIIYRLLRGRVLAAMGRAAEAIETLEDARIPARRIRALRLLEQIDGAIAVATSTTAEAGG